jgi:L-lactate dehydrogenase complex protein LldE
MRIGLFVTCLTDTLYPGTGRAVVAVLERLGHQVDFPAAQSCCGQMHFNTGYRREATPMARGFIAAFSGYEAIVTPSASCASMVREYYPALAAEARDPGLARVVAQIAPRTYELSVFLADVLGVTDVGAYFPHRVTYHPSCHSIRMLRVGDAPLRLLRAVRGIDLVDLPDAGSCCGFGGTFSVKDADVSAAICADKVAAVRRTGAEVLCAADNSCLMHVGGALTRQRSRWPPFTWRRSWRAPKAPRRSPRSAFGSIWAPGSFLCIPVPKILPQARILPGKSSHLKHMS